MTTRRGNRHWASVTFEIFFRNVTSSSRKLQSSQYSSLGKYPVIDQGEKEIGGYTNDETLVHPGPLPVVIFGDHTRCVKFASAPFVQGADGVKILAPARSLHARYAYWALKATELQNKGYARHYSLLRKLSFPLPPKPEQVRLVDAIESYLTRLDETVATLERVQRNLKRYRASVLKAAVEGRLVPTEAELARAEKRDYEPASELLKRILVERRRRWEEAELAKMKASGKTPKDDKWKAKYEEPAPPNTASLPKLPEGWCWASMNQLADIGTGATPNRSDKKYWIDGSVPWVTSAVVNAGLVTQPSAFVTQAALNETNLTLYPPGTLLVAMYGEGQTRGRCAELRISATTNQALAAITLHSTANLLRRWLLLFMQHNYLALRRTASGGVQPNLNLSIVRAIQVPLPPLCEQTRIADRAEQALSVASAADATTNGIQVRSNRLRQSVLKWAFEGKLVDQDPNDEPASVLLDRIRAERAAPQSNTSAKKPRRTSRNA
ncbi:MAG: restriction endonuclease subunit S [Polyangiaceae bacterium]|nr:restriction endonuclease subunit S [Polyangiaceae bacterium]